VTHDGRAVAHKSRVRASLVAARYYLLSRTEVVPKPPATATAADREAAALIQSLTDLMDRGWKLPSDVR
jgi:hypothetical protein